MEDPLRIVTVQARRGAVGSVAHQNEMFRRADNTIRPLFLLDARTLKNQKSQLKSGVTRIALMFASFR